MFASVDGSGKFVIWNLNHDFEVSLSLYPLQTCLMVLQCVCLCACARMCVFGVCVCVTSQTYTVPPHPTPHRSQLSQSNWITISTHSVSPHLVSTLPRVTKWVKFPFLNWGRGFICHTLMNGHADEWTRLQTRLLAIPEMAYFDDSLGTQVDGAS